MALALTPGTEQLLQIFIVVAGVLLVPVLVGVLVVLFKLAFLIHSASELMTIASVELTPMVRELRLMVGHLEDIGHKASSGVEDLGHSLHQAAPLVRKGFDSVKIGTSALLSGISRSFGR